MHAHRGHAHVLLRSRSFYAKYSHTVAKIHYSQQKEYRERIIAKQSEFKSLGRGVYRKRLTKGPMRFT